MKNRLLLITAFLFTAFYSNVNAQLKYTINESWHFIKDNSIQDINQFNSKKDKAELIDIPHTWNVEDVTDEEEGFYRGAGWYTKEVYYILISFCIQLFCLRKRKHFLRFRKHCDVILYNRLYNIQIFLFAEPQTFFEFPQTL